MPGVLARTTAVESWFSAFSISELRLSRPDHAAGSSSGVFGDLSSTAEPSCCLPVRQGVASDVFAGFGEASTGRWSSRFFAPDGFMGAVVMADTTARLNKTLRLDNGE